MFIARIIFMIVELITLVIVGAIVALLLALIVQIATAWIAKFTPKYAMAYKAVFLAFLAIILASTVLDIVLPTSIIPFAPDTFFRNLVPHLVLGFGLQCWVYGRMLKHPDTGPIGFGRACVVSLWRYDIVLRPGAAGYVGPIGVDTPGVENEMRR